MSSTKKKRYSYVDDDEWEKWKQEHGVTETSSQSSGSSSSPYVSDDEWEKWKNYQGVGDDPNYTGPTRESDGQAAYKKFMEDERKRRAERDAKRKSRTAPSYSGNSNLMRGMTQIAGAAYNTAERAGMLSLQDMDDDSAMMDFYTSMFKEGQKYGNRDMQDYARKGYEKAYKSADSSWKSYQYKNQKYLQDETSKAEEKLKTESPENYAFYYSQYKNRMADADKILANFDENNYDVRAGRAENRANVRDERAVLAGRAPGVTDIQGKHGRVRAQGAIENTINNVFGDTQRNVGALQAAGMRARDLADETGLTNYRQAGSDFAMADYYAKRMDEASRSGNDAEAARAAAAYKQWYEKASSGMEIGDEANKAAWLKYRPAQYYGQTMDAVTARGAMIKADKTVKDLDAQIEAVNKKIQKRQSIYLENAAFDNAVYDENHIAEIDPEYARLQNQRAELQKQRDSAYEQYAIYKSAYAYRQDLDESSYIGDLLTKLQTTDVAAEARQGYIKYNFDQKAAEDKKQEMADAGELKINIHSGRVGQEEQYRKYLKDATGLSYDLKNAKYMSQDQLQTYFAIYNSSPEDASRYAAFIQKMNEEQHWAEIRESAGQNFGSRLGSLVAAPVLGLASGIDPYSEWGQELSKLSEALQSGGAAGITKYGPFGISALSGEVDVPGLGKVSAGTFYNIGASMIQSGLVAIPAIAIGDTHAAAQAVAEMFGTAIMGRAAAASDYRERLAAGWSEEDALIHANMTALWEASFEYISLDNLVDVASTKSSIMRWLQQGGIEASEEACTTIFNRISDGALARKNGYDTSVEERMNELIANGMTYEEAERQAEKEWRIELLNDAFAGFLSGFGNAALTQVPGAAQQKYQNIRQQHAVWQATTQAANEAEAAKRYASDNQLTGQEFGSTSFDEGPMMDKVMQDIQNKMTGSNTYEGAEQVYNEITEKYGEGLSGVADQAMYNASSQLATNNGAETVVEKILEKKESVNAIKNERAKKAANAGLAAGAYKAAFYEALEKQQQKTFSEPMTMQATVTNEDGSERNESIVSLKDIKRGDKTVKGVLLTDGSVVELSNIQTDAATKDVLDTMAAAGMTEQASAEMLDAYTKIADDGSIDGYKWAQDYADTYNRGVVGGMDIDKAVMMADNLTAEIASQAYQAGQRDQGQVPAAQRMQLEKMRAQVKPGATGRNGVLWDGGVSRQRMKQLTSDPSFSRQLKAMRLIAEATGVDIHLFESSADESGNISQEQGSYSNGVIRIDVNAGLNNINNDLNRGLLAVTGHELTHWMKEYAPEAYQEYRNAVRDALVSSIGAEKLQRMVEARADKEGLSIDDALEEIIADSSMTQISSDDFWNALTESLGDKPNVWKSIKKFLAKWFDDIRNYIKGTSQLADAARVIDQMESTIQKRLGELYAKGIKEAKQSMQEVKAAMEDAEVVGASAQMAEEAILKQSSRIDEETLEFLDDQDHVTVYRAMQMIDGQLYPPMAAKVKGEDGKTRLVEPTEIGKWYQAVERPDLIDPKTCKWKLNKGNGSSISAAYNPYFHSSASPLNDQFSSAYNRPNLVVVEGIIPKSELTSGYKAQYAKDSVGETKWHSGPVAGQLRGDKARRVFLSRWFQAVRVLSDTEVAGMIAKTLQGENVAIPSNVVTPSLLEALRKAGVAIDDTGIERFEAAHQGKKNNAQEGDIKLSMRDDAAFREYEKTISETIDKAINNSGHLGTPYNQQKVSDVTELTARMVSAASDGDIDITGKSIALNGDDIYHFYKRHFDQKDIDRGQIPLTKRRLTNAIKAVYHPDIVECLIRKNINGTTRQSFAYAKKTARGHYLVVEAVGGKRNPNVVPIEAFEVSAKTWRKYMQAGYTLGEILYKSDPEKLRYLDVARNKASRVTATQFASDEAIATTSRSPQLNTSIDQKSASVNTSEEKKSSRITAEEDTEYLKLAKDPKKNAARLQKMVDEAARRAGYTIKVYHGTTQETISASKGRVPASEYAALEKDYADKLFPFVVFKENGFHTGIYTATDRGVAEDFTFSFSHGGTIYDLYARSENPLVIDAQKRGWNNLPKSEAARVGLTEDVRQTLDSYKKTRTKGNVYMDDIVEFAKKNGYDAVIAENVRETGSGDETSPLTTDVVVFSSKQLKSADPVTYDDSGKPIPLSERFNTENPDIRYSRRTSPDEGQVGMFGENNEPIYQEQAQEKTVGEQFLDAYNEFYENLKKTRRWRGTEFDQFYAEHPEMDFVERFFQNDPKVKTDLQEFLATIDDAATLEQMQWYTTQNRSAKRPDHVGSVRKVRNAYNKRIQELGTGHEISVEHREYSAKEVRKLFDELNSNEAVSALADKVFATANRLGLTYYGANHATGTTDFAGMSIGDNVFLKRSYFADKRYTNQQKAGALLHEIIHGCTAYALRNEYLASNTEASKNLRKAADTLQKIWHQARQEDSLFGTYGTKDVYEFVAELADADFRDKLKKVKLWDRIVDAIRNLLGIQKSNALDSASYALDYILDNADYGGAQKYYRNQEDAMRYWERTHNRQRYSTRDTSMPSDMDLIAGYEAPADATPEGKALLKDVKRSAKALQEYRQKYERLQAELRDLAGDNPSRISVKDFRRNVLDMFGVPASERNGDIGGLVQSIADGVLAGNKLSRDDIGFFFQEFVENGTMQSATDEYLAQIRNDLKGRSIYVSPTVKSDMGENYAAFRKRAFGLGIRLTNNEKDMGIDEAWSELADMYPGTFDADETDLGVMLEKLVDTAEAGKTSDVSILEGMEQVQAQTGEPVRDQLQALYDRFVRSIEILEDLAKLEAKARAGNAAEVAKAKQAAANAREKLSELRKERNDWKRKATNADRKAAAKLDAELRKIVQHDAKQIAEAVRQKEAVAAKLQKQIEREEKILKGILKPPEIQRMLKDAKEKATKEASQHKEEVYKAAKERKRTTEIRNRVKNLHEEMRRELVKPREGHYVPQALTGPVLDLLEMISTDTGRAKSESAQAKIDAINAAYDRIRKDNATSMYYDETVKDMLTELSATLQGRSIYELNADELSDVYTALKAMRTTIRNAIKADLIEKGRTIWDIGSRMIDELRNSKGEHRLGILESWHKAQLSPERAFNRFGGYMPNSAWNKAYDMLDKAQQKMLMLEMQGTRIFDPVLKSKKDFKQAQKLTSYGKNDLVEVGLKDADGNPVLITRGMMLSLYMHLQNEDNMRHLMYGGLTLPGLSQYYDGKGDAWGTKAVSIPALGARVSNLDALLQTEGEEAVKARYAAEEQEVREMFESVRSVIEDSLTPYERKWIAAAKEFFDGFSRRELNKATNSMYGFSKARVNNYFPIATDSDFLNTDIDTIKRDVSLENAGFMKERVRASNPILLEDITKVVNRQISKVAQYAGLTESLKTFDNIYKVKQKGFVDGVKKALHNTFGDKGQGYVENLLSDMVGGRSQPASIFDRVKGNYAQAILTLNLPVMVKQAASFPTAAAVTGWTPIVKALVKGGKSGLPISRANRALIDTYSPLLWYRAQGAIDTELGDVAQKKGWLARQRWAQGIQKIDLATVGRLWSAAEYYVEDHFKGLEKGTQEQIESGESPFYQKVGEVFNRIVEETQPNYTVLQRPDILRNPDKIIRAMTMFSTQRLQNANILIDAAATYNAVKQYDKKTKTAESKAMRKEARTNLTRAISSQIASAVVLVAMDMVGKALLHRVNPYRDDDDELTAESVGLAALDSLAETLTGAFLWGSETFKVVNSILTGSKYYENDVGGISTVNSLLSGFVDLAQKATKMYEGDETPTADDWLALLKKEGWNLAKPLAQMTGMPVENVQKLLNAAYYHAIDAANGQILSFEAGLERSQKTNVNRYMEAWTVGDEAKMDTVLAEMKRNYLDDGKDEEKAAELMRNAIGKAALEKYDAEEMDLQELSDYMEGTGLWDDEKRQDKLAGIIRDELQAGLRTEDEAIDLLTDLCGFDEDKAWKKAKEWSAKAEHADDEDYSYSQYDEIDEALARNDNIESLVREMTDHGVKADSIRSHVKSWLIDNYAKGNVSEYAFKNQLSRYLQITAADDVNKILKDANSKKSYGVAYSSLDEEYRAGKITKTNMKAALMKYGGLDSDEADRKIRWYDLQKNNPSLEITESVCNTWYDGTKDHTQKYGHRSAKAEGMSIAKYVEAKSVLSKVTGTDLDGDGKTDTNSREKAYIQAISGIGGLTSAQRWALYYEEYSGANWKKIAKPNW